MNLLQPPSPDLAVVLAWFLLVPSLGLIGLIDCRRLEIDPWLCALAALAGSVLAVPASPMADRFLGAGLALGFALAWQHLRPASFGLGDRYLYMLCGFLAGAGGLMVWAFLHALAAILLALPRARRKGRPLLRTGMPAAVSACPAVLVVLVLGSLG